MSSVGTDGGGGRSVPFDVTLVARIGLSVAAVACAGIWLVLFVLADDRGTTYRYIIGAADLTRENLGPAMLIFGLAMAFFAGIAAWLFSLYSSFRIAGPLYRLSRNLERLMIVGPAPPVPIRKSDQLQHEWQRFEAAVAALRVHHEDLMQATDDVQRALDDGGSDTARIELAIEHLGEVEARVRL